MLGRRSAIPFLLVVCSLQAGCSRPANSAADGPEVAAAKRAPYHGGTLEGLLGKYCDKPSWRFDADAKRVEFRGVHKASGQDLVMRFLVFFGPVDKSNTAEDWVVVPESAVLGGRDISTTLGENLFVDEDRASDGPGKRVSERRRKDE